MGNMVFTDSIRGLTKSMMQTGGYPSRKIRLASNNREKEIFDEKANLYSIIKTTNALEKAYSNDAISIDEYQSECSKLIGQFHTAKRITGINSAEEIKKFMNEYSLVCRAAEFRLLEVGIPDVGKNMAGDARIVSEVVAHFITLMDSLKLNMVAIDEIQPLFSQLMESLSRCSSSNFEDSGRLQNWLITLNSMKATDELNTDQSRQMLLDLENAYTSFHNSL
eukprot:TRINITY_DN5681_c0_g1_i1.p1 TRINITY_DN5681_c0_g1~~TRINITY_DN5681_c0_g1_i1.p1  ORF type:complete len:222 (-),score=42.15 TRINITY_DN5681_c0_g1_i1:19-684(-)